jgi:surfeit locus 1 family protein
VEDVLRTALRPASLGLLALMLAAATAFAALGHWQLDRSREHARPAPTERVVPLATVLAPASPFTGKADAQRVSVTGQYVASDTVLVPGRELAGRAGSWVVTALRVGPDGAAGSGGLLPVVRGWLPAGQDPPPPPAGAVPLTGRLQVSEEPHGVGADGRLRAVSSADLVNLWQPPLYTGFLLAGAAQPPLTAVPSPAPHRQLDLQNLSYAFQWWLFAVFAVLFWVKIVRDRHRAELEDRAEGEGTAWEDEERARDRSPAHDAQHSQEVRS